MSFAVKDLASPTPSPAPAAVQNSIALLDEASLWAGFSGAKTASEFCQSWLALQCRDITDAGAGLLLLQEGGGRYTPAAVWPDRTHDVTHLAGVAQDALEQRSGVVIRGVEAAQVAYPIEVGGVLQGVVVVEVRNLRQEVLVSALRRLHWGAGWLETLFRRREGQRDGAQIARNSLSLDMLACAAEHPAQREGATAIVTQLATRLACSRVSLGLVKGKGVKLAAISHQATFQERAQVIDAIENAMEEAFDQHAVVVVPPLPRTARAITLAQMELARLSGARAVASVPLDSAGRPIGVLTLERDEDVPFTEEELAQLGAVSVALAPVVEARAQSQRLVAGTLIDGTARGWKVLLGPGHPGLKLGAILAVGAIAWLVLASGDFRVSARTAIEGSVQRAAIAPFEGFLASAAVRAGDLVESGQVLAKLDDRELVLEAARWRAEREQQLLKYQEALGKQDRAQARILAAQARQAEAQLALVEGKVERASIRAPFRGLVVSGDVSQSLGAPVESGKVLFEIAPLDDFRAVLQVEERDLIHLREGQEGTLRLAGQVSSAIPVRVTKVTPVANTQDGRNTFRVEAELTQPNTWVRPGMEGVAKIDIEPRPLLWVWTRSLIDWARLALWTIWP